MKREAAKSKDHDLEYHPAAGSQTLWKGIQLLEMVGTLSPRPRFKDLMKASRLPKGTLHRLLQTLIDSRLVKLEPSDQTYRLGTLLFEMAHKVWSEFDLRGAATSEMERLFKLANETVRLGVLNDYQVLYIDQIDSFQPVKLGGGVGSRADIHSSGLGKAILTHIPESKSHLLLKDLELTRHTPNTITEIDELKRHLKITKARGYSVSIEEQHIGINAVAAAILDHKAEPLGAIGVIGPAFRLTPDRLHALGREVIEAARRISGNIGETSMSITVMPKPFGADRDDLKCVFPGTAFIGKEPHWSSSSQKLYWVDMLAPAIYAGDPASNEYKVFPMQELVGAVVPRTRGGFVVAMQSGFKAVDLESGSTTLIADPEANLPGNRFNAGKCDKKGRLWAGSLSIDTAPDKGGLWCLDIDGSVRKMDDGFHISNGMGWSPDDKKFYFTDSVKRLIYEYDFDLESGSIENRRTFVEVPEGVGVPDGLTVDSEGCVWSVHWDGWCITRYDPEGNVERVINVPVPRPTSCAFGGPDLSTLYISSARIRLSAQELVEAPLSGSIFALDAGVKGLPSNEFAG